MIVTPTWQTQSWFPELFRLSVRNPIIFVIKGRLTKGSSKPTASSYPKPNNTISSVACLRKRFAEKEISERVSDHIVSSRREGTLSAYSSAWNKWLAGVLNKKLIQFDVM